MVMVYVPGGIFQMGSDTSDTSAKDDEFPQHTVTLDGFWMDRTEVINALPCFSVPTLPPSQDKALRPRSRERGSLVLTAYDPEGGIDTPGNRARHKARLGSRNVTYKRISRPRIVSVEYIGKVW
jgi:hypothetical protein